MQLHRFVGMLALASVLAWGTVARAEDDAVRIGVIDVDQALSSTDEGKRAMEEIQRKQKEAEGQLKPMLERVKSMEEEMKSKQFVLSDEARYQKQLDFVQKQKELESRAKELQDGLQIDAERIRGPLVKKLGEAVREFGKENGYTLILVRGAPGLAYAREAIDVTDQVVAKFNSK